MERLINILGTTIWHEGSLPRDVCLICNYTINNIWTCVRLLVLLCPKKKGQDHRGCKSASPEEALQIRLWSARSYCPSNQDRWDQWQYVVAGWYWKVNDCCSRCIQKLNKRDQPPPGYKYMKCHIIFEIKLDGFQRKARLVGSGCMIKDTPAVVTHDEPKSGD